MHLSNKNFIFLCHLVGTLIQSFMKNKKIWKYESFKYVSVMKMLTEGNIYI